jgi:hypothetical protein
MNRPKTITTVVYEYIKTETILYFSEMTPKPKKLNTDHNFK